MALIEIKNLMGATYSEWDKDKGPKLAAALSYYTVLSLAPLLVITIAIASLVFDAKAARGQIVSGLGGLLGDEGASTLQNIITSTAEQAGKGGNVLATIFGIIVLLLMVPGTFFVSIASLEKQ